MNLSLYWFLSIRTRAISTRVNLFLKLHESLLILVSLHQNPRHLDPSESLPLSHRHVLVLLALLLLPLLLLLLLRLLDLLLQLGHPGLKLGSDILQRFNLFAKDLVLPRKLVLFCYQAIPAIQQGMGSAFLQ